MAALIDSYYFFPVLVRGEILTEINKIIVGSKISQGEFVRFIHIWFLMASVAAGCDYHSILYGIYGIALRIELVRGLDASEDGI